MHIGVDLCVCVCVFVCVCLSGGLIHLIGLSLASWLGERVFVCEWRLVGGCECAHEYLCAVCVFTHVCVCVLVCVSGSTIRCQSRCCLRPGGVTAGLGTRMRSESVRKGGSKSRSACCRYIVYLKGAKHGT